MRDTKKTAPQLLQEHRRAMWDSKTKEEAEFHKKQACKYSEIAYLYSCCTRNCETCYITREENDVVRRIKMEMGGAT